MIRAIVGILCLTLVTGCSPAEGEERAGSAEGTNPVVVELFTSQGCSSCPPADRVLRKIASDPELAKRVIPLSFHVAYWNYLGWSDPFSSTVWTERQRRYSRAVGVDVYTPQVVVNGRRAMVGSNERDVRRAIAIESRKAPRVTLSIESIAIEDGRLSVAVSAEPAHADVWIAVWESGLTTKVDRGENSGRTLENDRVVRWLQPLDLGEDGAHGSASIELGRGWKTDALGVVAFAQDPDSMEIIGAVAN